MGLEKSRPELQIEVENNYSKGEEKMNNRLYLVTGAADYDKNNSFDYSKAQKEIGYKTRPYKETIKDEIAWLKANGHI